MKRNILIILLLSMSLLLTLSSISQNKKDTFPLYPNFPTGHPILIADETWITYSKTEAIFVTYSQSVFDTIYTKFTFSFLHPRVKGKFFQPKKLRKFTAYMRVDSALAVSNWCKTNL